MKKLSKLIISLGIIIFTANAFGGGGDWRRLPFLTTALPLAPFAFSTAYTVMTNSQNKEAVLDAEQDALVVLENGIPTDRFQLAKSVLEEAFRQKFNSNQEAAIAILQAIQVLEAGADFNF